MKKILTIILSLLLISSLMLAGCDTKYNKGSSVIKWGTEIVLNIDLPDFPDKLSYYTTVQPEVTAEWVQSIGDKMGILDEVGFTESGNRFIMSEGDEWLEVNGDNGAVTVRGIHIPHEMDSILSSSENAGVIATEFVKYLGLWDENITLNKVSLRYEDILSKQEWGVYFNQDVESYPLVGVGKLFHVIVNPYGTILSAGFYNPELEHAGEVDCITVQEAYDLFLDGESLGFNFSPSFNKVSVNDVYIGYYNESQTELQEYFMPVYVFEGELFTTTGDTEIFRAYVLAANS
ncbi:MAG: hypothetical protein PHF74_07675 [Dehalococcoidales bacterium]|nr:hypothetical protein [Dehalococcoidales bacterium]